MADSALDLFFGDLGADLADLLEGFVDSASSGASESRTTTMQFSKHFKADVPRSCILYFLERIA